MAEPRPAEVAELSVERERTVDAPPALVWAIAADTNRWDRVVGAGPSTYTIDDLAGEGRTQVGHGVLAGAQASWLERGEWMEGEFLLGERRYLGGPLAVAGVRIDAAAEGTRTRVKLRAYVRPRQALPERFTAALIGNFARAADEYLTALEQLFRGAMLPDPDPDEPPVTYARRALAVLEPDALLAGDRSGADEQHIAYCATRLVDTPIAAEHRDKILGHLRSGADAELAQVRPFELARAWHVKRRPLLRAFLHAATAGLFDLRWQLDCPRCRVGVTSRPTLAAIAPRAHCEICDLEFDVDLAANVEAVFCVNPAVRPITERVYCTSSPWFRPHVFAVAELAPGETRTLHRPTTIAGFIARTTTGDAKVTADGGAFRLRLDAGGLTAEPLPTAPAATVELVNQTTRPAVLLLERREAQLHAARGTDILTMPEFLDLYGTEAPASGAEISVGSLTVLFSDLTNTTELYRQVGDARAFALVQEHFRDMAAIIAECNGAILKTMGDAVMASFVAPADAVAAALQMIDATRRRHGPQSLHLKVGLHDGPCLVVPANGGVDLFGTTVNIASRLQAQAHADELVMADSLLAHPEVARLLASRSLTARRAAADLKGLGPNHALALITP